MKKNEFIAELCEKLNALGAEDIERSLDYYSEVIDDCMEDGMTEDEAVAQVGSVEEAIANILDDPAFLNTQPILGERKPPETVNGAEYNGLRFDSLLIEDSESDVLLVPSEDGSCIVEWNEKLPHTVEVLNGVLTIRRLTERKWFQFFVFKGEQAKLIVRIPAGKYNDLTLSTASGDIQIPRDFAFNNAEVRSASGDVEFFARVSGKLRAKSTSGDVATENITPREAEFITVSGDLNCARINTQTQLLIKSVSGDIEASDLKSGELLLKTVSGDIKLDRTNAGSIVADSISGDISFTAAVVKAMSIRTTSGDVGLDRCDGGEINVKTNSGSVRGSLLSGKMFHCTSRSGSVKVPEPTAGGICKVSTTSGSIRLKVE